jgi:hypothetical protein
VPSVCDGRDRFVAKRREEQRREYVTVDRIRVRRMDVRGNASGAFASLLRLARFAIASGDEPELEQTALERAVV